MKLGTAVCSERSKSGRRSLNGLLTEDGGTQGTAASRAGRRPRSDPIPSMWQRGLCVSLRLIPLQQRCSASSGSQRAGDNPPRPPRPGRGSSPYSRTSGSPGDHYLIGSRRGTSQEYPPTSQAALNPKPSTLNHEPQTLQPKSKPSTVHPEPSTPTLKSQP